MSSTVDRITYPPLVAHGPDNNGAIVVVITYSFMFITILFAILRSYSSYMQKRELSWDDITFSIAVVRNTAFSLQIYGLWANHLSSAAAGHTREHSYRTGCRSRTRAAYCCRFHLQSCQLLQGMPLNVTTNCSCSRLIKISVCLRNSIVRYHHSSSSQVFSGLHDRAHRVGAGDQAIKSYSQDINRYLGRFLILHNCIPVWRSSSMGIHERQMYCGREALLCHCRRDSGH